MNNFKKGIVLTLTGGFLAAIVATVAYPLGALTLVQIIVGGTAVSSSNPLPVTAGGSGLTATVNQGTSGTNAQSWWEQIGDGTNGPASVKTTSVNAATTDKALVADPRPNSAVTISGTTTNPTSTLTMTSATTAYTANQLIATNATAGSVVNPSFAIANSAGGAAISRLRLDSNDTTSTAWGAQTIQVDLWSTTPTWTNGDRAAWSPATGTGVHLGSFTCIMSAEYGDGVFSECSPTVGNYVNVALASGTAIYWSLKATTGSGVTGASKVWTLTAEILN